MFDKILAKTNKIEAMKNCKEMIDRNLPKVVLVGVETEVLEIRVLVGGGLVIIVVGISVTVVVS